jgi:hypothetical protein
VTSRGGSPYPAVDLSIRAACSIRAAALTQVAARAKKAFLFSGSLVDSAQDRHCLALAPYVCATMLTMLITLRLGDATPKGEARLSKIAHVRCGVDGVDKEGEPLRPGSWQDRGSAVYALQP